MCLSWYLDDDMIVRSILGCLDRRFSETKRVDSLVDDRLDPLDDTLICTRSRLCLGSVEIYLIIELDTSLEIETESIWFIEPSVVNTILVPWYDIES
jgi:hypothetical protein